MWRSENSTAWTVVYEADPQFQTSCLHRFVYVKGTPDLESVLRGADASARKSFDGRGWRRRKTKRCNLARKTAALGCDARVSARPDAESAADLAA